MEDWKKYQEEVAHLFKELGCIAEIEASCYVLDFGVNLPDADSLKIVYGPFLKILRGKRTNTPIIAVTPIYNDLIYSDGFEAKTN